jgi:hypothetical protein
MLALCGRSNRDMNRTNVACTMDYALLEHVEKFLLHLLYYPKKSHHYFEEVT